MPKTSTTKKKATKKVTKKRAARFSVTADQVQEYFREKAKADRLQSEARELLKDVEPIKVAMLQAMEERGDEPLTIGDRFVSIKMSAGRPRWKDLYEEHAGPVAVAEAKRDCPESRSIKVE